LECQEETDKNPGKNPKKPHISSNACCSMTLLLRATCSGARPGPIFHRTMGHIVGGSLAHPAHPLVVDVSQKHPTTREAIAVAKLFVKCARGDPVSFWWPEDVSSETVLTTTASIAGISAAKHCATVIPLCHNLPLHKVTCVVSRPQLEEESRPAAQPNTLYYFVRVVCTAKTEGRTGVEMEALVGASTAALTLYDMLKGSLGHERLEVGGVHVVHKSGGKSGGSSDK